MDLNNEQKNLHRFMKKHPFQDTPQAPGVDINMIRNLGPASSKKQIAENVWQVSYQNGTEYEGSIVEDSGSPDFGQPISSGKFKFPNGDRYEGSVGKRAKGVYRHSNGVVFKGQFFQLKKSGEGTQTFPSGGEYQGKFRDNRYQGKGQFKFANNEVYSGGFSQGLREHIGTYSFPGGEKVVGDWRADKLHGNGEYEFTGGWKVKSGFKNSHIKLG